MLRRTSGKRGVASRVYPPGASHFLTFADRCLPCTMYHVRRPLLDLYLTLSCPRPVLSIEIDR